MKVYSFTPQGVCSQRIDIAIEGDTIQNVSFFGGCNGNLKAISKIVDGWTADDIADAFTGNTCGFKSTSCADQLATAVMKAKNGEL